MMRVRPATTADAAGIARLATELGYPSSEEEMATRLHSLLRSESHFVGVAEDGPNLVGWVAAERRLLLESGTRVELVGLIVGSSARRRGTGRELVAAAEAWALGQGVKVIIVRSNVARLESHPFYERLGYERTKTQHAYSRQL